jgi:hypothetical protein
MIELLEFLKMIDKSPEPMPDFFKLAKKKDRLPNNLHKDEMRPIHHRIVAEEKQLWLYNQRC